MPLVLIAPDSFKGTFTAGEVADAVAAGVRAAGARADACPLADGGEGTGDVLLAAHGGTTVTADALDPLGRRRRAAFALLTDGRTAVVETAAASGLPLVAEHERDAERASTYGTGELIVAARDAGARTILVGAGGAATTDGGAGCLEAIRAHGGLRGAQLVVLCDVTTAWERAAATFAPQKGADPAAVHRLTQRLDELAARLPRDPRGVPRTGCAGGLSGGLWATHGARLVSGAGWILRAVRFDRRLAASDALVVGEGTLDAQSTAGKILGTVLARCGGPVPVHAVVGRCALQAATVHALGITRVWEAPTIAHMVDAGRAIATAIGRAAVQCPHAGARRKTSRRP